MRMSHPLAVAALAAALLTAGCVAVPSHAPPPPAMAPAAARTPSPVPEPGQASARTALVTTAATRTPKPRAGQDRRVPEPRSADTPARRVPRADPPTRPRPVTPPRAPHRPAAPAAPRRPAELPSPARPQPSYDLGTVCGWSHHSPVPPAVRDLCDTYVHSDG
ncbi:hypothetical protein ACWCPF_35885 [Streptomyces sp. NPDC001858]